MARSKFRSQNIQNTPGPEHFWKFRCRKSARRCGAKHISKLKYLKDSMFGYLFPERPGLIYLCQRPVDTWMDKPLDCPSDFRFKQLLCEKLLELGASYVLPKVEGERLNVGQFKCSSLLMQAALVSLGVTHLYIGHFGATIPYHPEILSSEADQLTALDLAVTDHYPGVPLVGIYIGESSGISRAELGWDTPDLKLRVQHL